LLLLLSSGFKEFHETIHLVKADNCLQVPWILRRSMSTLLDEAFREIFSWPIALRQPRRTGWNETSRLEVSGAHSYPP
jgi:hypothetical protein